MYRVKGKFINEKEDAGMENEKQIKIFMQINSTTGVMIESLRKFYSKEYEVEMTAACIIEDSIFDRFIQMLAEEAKIKN
jgi:hypothetical protein